MGKRYYCDYCNRAFQDNLNARKKHLNSAIHLKNRGDWYYNFKDAKQIFLENVAKKPCNKYLATGSCPFGDRCKYRHMKDEDILKLKEEVETTEKQAMPPTEDILDKWLAKRKKFKLVGTTSKQVSEVEEIVLESFIPAASAGLPDKTSLPPSLMPPPHGGWLYKCEDFTEWG